MAHYSRPAVEFQKSIRRGALFRVHDYPDHIPHHGQTLMIKATLKATDNPDDYLYRVSDDKGVEHDVRSWWLRRNSERVD